MGSFTEGAAGFGALVCGAMTELDGRFGREGLIGRWSCHRMQIEALRPETKVDVQSQGRVEQWFAADKKEGDEIRLYEGFANAISRGRGKEKVRNACL